MEQTELFEIPHDTHRPKVYYYRCGEGLIFKDGWRYFSFQLVQTKANVQRKARERRRSGQRNRRKRNP